jgi:hypothetical protein
MATGLGRLFLRSGDTLEPLEEQHLSLEGTLQELLAEQPQLIPLQEIEPELTRPPLLVMREAKVAGMELDHLFVTERAVPVLVECKRGSNREARREVVAQMIDYAANARLEWDADDLAAMLARRCEVDGLDPAQEMSALEHAFPSDDEFWQECERNLRARAMWLLFVADEINERLKRVVEYLNESMAETTVLAMEVVQFAAGAQQLYQSRLVGETETAAVAKGRTRKGDVLSVLVENGEVSDGRALWALPSAIPVGVRPSDPADPRLRVSFIVEDGRPRLRYAPPGGEPITETPSKMINHVRRAFDPAYAATRFHSLAEKYSLEPGGTDLGTYALEKGIWE